MNDFLQQFLIESREFSAQAAEGLLQLEKTPHDAETLDTVFRAFHTLKGGAGIVEFSAMESALHATETLLQDARTGKRTLTAGFIGDCLASLDRVSEWLDALERTGELPAVGTASIGGESGEAASRSAASELLDWESGLLARQSSVAAQAATAFRFTPDPDCFYKGEDPIARTASLSRLLALEIEPANPWRPLKEFDPYLCNIVLTGLTAAGAEEVAAHFQHLSGECELRALKSAAPSLRLVSLPDIARKVLQEQLAVLDVKENAGAAGRLASAGVTAANALRFSRLDAQADSLAVVAQQALAQGSSASLRESISALLLAIGAPDTASPAVPIRKEASARTLRINAEQIDALVRLTGELTVAKNAIGHTAQMAQSNKDSTASLLRAHHANFDRLVSQLQNSVIGMRVLPLRTVFQRFPRVLREMSLSLGRPTQLQVEGEDTEADKTIVEMLFEPLLHVVRNAIDHGVEDAPRRLAAGKPPVATIRLRAAREGNQVLVEVSDDGGGIDVERVRKVAKQRGVATEQELGSMADAQVIDLVFAPGFSTAARVTEISGRGVGMDAVRTAVQSVGGKVSIATRLGAGTTVSFALPFSVMMTQVMTVEAGGQVFGIPLDAIVETIGVSRQALASVGEALVIVHRNRTIPVVELADVLNAARPSERNAADATIVIAAVADQLVGLHVDRPGERMEVILKPLDGLLAGTPGVAGTTVLGDGRVLLILDVAELLQ
jgi:two-component system chemotaxis sensor kinase CheA